MESDRFVFLPCLLCLTAILLTAILMNKPLTHSIVLHHFLTILQKVFELSLEVTRVLQDGILAVRFVSGEMGGVSLTSEGRGQGHYEALGVITQFVSDQLLHFSLEVIYHFVYSLSFPEYFFPSRVPQLHLSAPVDLYESLLGHLFILMDEFVQLPPRDSLVNLFPAFVYTQFVMLCLFCPWPIDVV